MKVQYNLGLELMYYLYYNKDTPEDVCTVVHSVLRSIMRFGKLTVLTWYGWVVVWYMKRFSVDIRISTGEMWYRSIGLRNRGNQMYR